MVNRDGPADDLPSRRRFVAGVARLTTGSALAPTLLLSAPGCRHAAVPEASADHTLTAGRFTASPDGRPREVWGYNKQLPGPTIRAREGDLLRIKVVNGLTVPTSIHWHGIHQHGTWTMDGVEEVSRPPIPAGSEFLYEFRAEPAGTHWYHAHVGVQYGNGLFGPLIIEERAPIAAYDREEVLLINDWFHDLGDAILARLLDAPEMKVMPGKMPRMPMPDAKAMPGKMAMKKDVADVPFQSGLINGRGRAGVDARGPLTVVEVKKGETLRLRLINGSSTFAFRVQVDGHPLTVIASDGSPLKPVVVDNLSLSPGERYDVLLKADKAGTHRVRAVTPDGNAVLAVLRYAGSEEAEPSPTPVEWGPRALMPAMLRSPGPVTLADKPRAIPLVMAGTMKPYRWSIGEQYYPKAAPIAVAKDEPIRFDLRNPTGMDHPFHLHGHSFHVLGAPGALNLDDPPLKDTINLPAGAELIVQWVADNPGRWFFHCHIEWHLATGMARVIEVEPY